MDYSAKSLNQLYSRVLIEELFRFGVNCFFISPGSRSAPFISAVVENSNCEKYTHFDERGSAFAALGYARATGKPVGLICTSGTALGNYYPAVVEAYMDRIPLILLTADRPPELQNSGANQTIYQNNFYGKYVRSFLNIDPPNKNKSVKDFLLEIDSTINIRQDGPVHINCMFREPLAPLGNKKNYKDKFKPIKVWTNSNKPLTKLSKKRYLISQIDLDEITNLINKSKKTIICCGYLKKQSDRNAIVKLAEKKNFPIFADIRSGLRVGYGSKNIISHFDLQLSKKDYLEDSFTVLHFGGSITSKRFLQKIERSKSVNYIHINENDFIYNPHKKVTKVVQGYIEVIAKRLLTLSEKSNSIKFLNHLIKNNEKISTYCEQFFESENNMTEPLTTFLISKNIKSKSSLFLGSSMPIRDFDMFAGKNSLKISIVANRGASGIDGSIGSLFGYCAGSDTIGTALIGDLAFLHDISSLSLLKQSKKPIVIVVLNNKGGGIFSFLPISKCNDIFEKYFATPHNYNFRNVAKMFGLDYYFPDSPDDFVNIYNNAQEQSRSSIIEIQTDRNHNEKYHRKIIKELNKL